jgi:hypothetical protein
MKLNQLEISTLIRSLPIPNHSVRVKRSTWVKKFAKAGLHAEFKMLFGNAKEISIKRKQIHEQANTHRKCIEVLLWGYPKGMRGKEVTYLANLKQISASAESNAPWEKYHAELNSNKGLGMSTITKLAYFFEKTFDGIPAVILDRRIIQILERATWDELNELRHVTYSNAHKNYPSYLRVLHSIAQSIRGASQDQVEFFLFALGDAFECLADEANRSPRGKRISNDGKPTCG